ncbi:hypothetical protein LTR62_007501 [Meristemomyces frigidus]|uniref:BED-type domain-containing protein n=1 Tax=Meristemomyces frigidus TaxID=1508187 RepID=A0AAN7TB67_9PEZI|nr:hypothetical protein LTR62_007501 [Meristemomyces frigidus]
MVGKKKRNHETMEDVLGRPWCYYCERDFDDLKILMNHQKAKHFKCDKCNRRLNTIGGLRVHMSQVHKENIDTVENALPGRTDVDVEIFGMEGIPEDVMSAHNAALTESYFRKEAEWRAKTGNPPPGVEAGEPPKQKIKIETPEEMKARLAAFKARKAAEKAGLTTSSGSGGNTPKLLEGSMLQGVAASNMPQYANNSSSSPSGVNPYPPPPLNNPLFNKLHGAPIAHGGLMSPAPYQQQFMPPAQFPNQYSPMIHQHSPYEFQPPNGFSPAPFTPYQQPQQKQWSPPAPMNGPAPALGTGLIGLPPAPGLPPRPTFNPPNLSKEDMAKMHSGYPSVGANMPAPQVQIPDRRQKPLSTYEYIKDEVDDLISSVTGEGAYVKQAAIHQEAVVEPKISVEGVEGSVSALPAQLQEAQVAVEVAKPDAAVVNPDTTAGGSVIASIDTSGDGSGATAIDTTAKPSAPATEDGAARRPAVDAPKLSIPAPAEGVAKKSKRSKKEKKEKVRFVYGDEITSPEEKLAARSKYRFNRI